MREFELNGYDTVSLYARISEAEAPRASLLIIHGFGEHGARYQDMAEYFTSRGITVLTFDNRGHGRSEGKRGVIKGWEEYRYDTRSAAAELARLCPVVPMFVFGHSLGGTIALDYVLTSDTPPRGLIVSAPALGTPGVSPFLLAASRVLSVLTPKLALHAGLDTKALSRDPQVVRDYEEDPLVHGLACPRLSTELTAAQKRIFDRIGTLDCPLLICHGSDDRIAPGEPVERLYESTPVSDKALRIFEGAYHELHNDLIRDDIYRLYADWILERA